MKIRTDFVTNSSSSSYVTIKIESEIVSQIIKDLKNKWKDFQEFFDDIDYLSDKEEVDFKYGLDENSVVNSLINFLNHTIPANRSVGKRSYVKATKQVIEALKNNEKAIEE